MYTVFFKGMLLEVSLRGHLLTEDTIPSELTARLHDLLVETTSILRRIRNKRNGSLVAVFWSAEG